MKLIKLLFLTTIFSGCIGTDVIEDLVEPKIVVDNALISLKVGDSHQFSAKYFDNLGQEGNTEISWLSNNPSIVSVTHEGVITANAFGEAIITAQADDAILELPINGADETVAVAQERIATLRTSTSYDLSGTATLRSANGRLILSFSEDFVGDSALPGLYVYLSNSTTNVSNAVEVSKITQFTGAQAFEVADGVDLFDYTYVFFYCKPFTVPVGSGELNP